MADVAIDEGIIVTIGHGIMAAATSAAVSGAVVGPDPWAYIAGAVVSAITTVAIAWITGKRPSKKRPVAPAPWPPASQDAVAAARGW